MIDVRQLQYFVAVAEELHFGRAAARAGIAQPPLTQQIQKVERELGYPLLVRTSRKTALTEAGAVLLAEARQVLARYEHALDATRRAGRGETGRLAVGTPPSVMLSALPKVIRRYRERYPEVAFSLRELSTAAIAEALESGTLDVGFLREASPSATLAAQVVLEEAVVAVLPSAHPLARRPRLTLKTLAREPFVLFPRRLGEVFHRKLMSFCEAAGFTPRVVQEATQWQSVVSMVEAGVGVSLAPDCVRRFRFPGVVYRPLPGLSTSVSVCWPAGPLQIPATVQSFLRYTEQGFKRP